MSALDPTQISNLLKQDSLRATTSRARTPKDPTEPREYPTWFKLNHRFGKCSNPECCDTRESGGTEGTAMVADVNGNDSCRYCFLAGYGKTTQASD